MKTKSPKRFAPWFTLILAAAVTLFTAACHTASPPKTAAAAAPSPRPQAGKGGAQLWSENCARCHNIRSPATYSDAEWDVAVHHMRIRANLTAEEHRSILEFLKSAN